MMSCVVTIAVDAIQADIAGSADAAEKIDRMRIQVSQTDPGVEQIPLQMLQQDNDIHNRDRHFTGTPAYDLHGIKAEPVHKIRPVPRSVERNAKPLILRITDLVNINLLRILPIWIGWPSVSALTHRRI